MPSKSKTSSNGHGKPGFSITRPDPAGAQRNPSGHEGARVHGKDHQRSARTMLATTIILALLFAYVLMTIGSMVPQARGHFLDLFLNPQPAHFLKSN